MTNDSITFISSEMTEPKKDYTLRTRDNYYLNHSLLGLASIASYKNFPCFITQGNSNSPSKTLGELENLGNLLFISLGSALSVEWTRLFTKLVKESSLEIFICCEGSYVINNNYNLIESKLSNIDLFVNGYAESELLNIIKNHRDLAKEGKFFEIRVNTVEPFRHSYNYDILKDFQMYTPSIELSRVFGKDCEFCVDDITPIRRCKKLYRIV